MLAALELRCLRRDVGHALLQEHVVTNLSGNETKYHWWCFLQTWHCIRYSLKNSKPAVAIVQVRPGTLLPLGNVQRR